MRAHKRYCVAVAAFVAGLVLFNGLIWTFCTRSLLTRHQGVIIGDLARMGYQPDCVHPRRNKVDLPRRHIPAREHRGQRVDLVTIGDSFSNGMAFGRNRFYQDYIATLQGLSVMNVPPLPETTNFLETVAVMLNSGYLEELGARFVLIEQVERSAVTRLAKTVDFARSLPLDKVRVFFTPSETADTPAGEALPPVGFFNTGNLKFVLFNLGYLFSDRGFVSQVSKMKLDRPLFSGPSGQTLLFLNKDIDKLKYVTGDSVAKVNDNLNRLARMLKAKGIALYFMPAVNKYTLYRPFIVDNPYPESPFFEMLRSLPREYELIDTKAILNEELAKGTKDVFFIDDTHWSWKASQVIFNRVRFR